MSRKFYLNSISISFKLIHNFRSRCSCGNSFLYKIASSSKCSKTCSGNSNQNCGSKWLYFSVYRERDNTSTISDSLVVPISNMSASQISQILSNSSGNGLIGCLLGCSNHGQCNQDPITQQLSCLCDEFFEGDSCQIDTRPCSYTACLYGATCSNIFTSNSTSFECICAGPFYGVYCENMIDLCQNVSCGRGQCRVSSVNATTSCVCFNGYVGIDCSEKSSVLKLQNSIVSGATILTFILLGLFVALILFMDYLKFFVIKDKRVKETQRKKVNKNLKVAKAEETIVLNDQKHLNITNIKKDFITNNINLIRFKQLKKALSPTNQSPPSLKSISIDPLR